VRKSQVKCGRLRIELRTGLCIGLLCLCARLVQAQASVITALNASSVTAGGAGFTLSVTGANFGPSAVGRVNGANRATLYLGPTHLQISVLSSDVASPGSLLITVWSPAAGGAGSSLSSNPLSLAVSPPASPIPTLGSATPEFASPGASEIRLTLIGTNFRPGAVAVVSPPLASLALSTGNVEANDVVVQSTTVVNSTLIVAQVTVGAHASASLRAVDVLNLDGTTTGTLPGTPPGTSKAFRIAPSTSLGAPLNVTTIAVLNPRNGAVFSQGEEAYGQAQLAATGSGVVVGAWYWDDSIIEQFAVNVAGGQSVGLRAQNRFPTEQLGPHTVELRIFQPNRFSSRPLSVVVNPGEFSLEGLLAPAYGARITAKEPPELRWAPAPGIGEYQVGFATQPYFSEIKSWHAVSENFWNVPEDIWKSLPEGELYWTVRAVEMSGTAWKALPMRLLLRFPNDALTSSRARPSITPQGNPLLEWKGLEGWHLYRVTISTDPAGEKIVRRYLTASPHIDLRALKGKLDAAQTYHWFVEVLDGEGRTILTGPSNELSFQNSPQSRKVPIRELHLMPAAYTQPLPDLSSSDLALADLAKADPTQGSSTASPQKIKTISNRVPAPEATVANPKAPIVIDFSAAPNVFDLAIQLDGTDVTSLCDVAETKVTYTPPVPIPDGSHTVLVTLGSDTADWKFTIKALSAAEAKKLSDAEAAKANGSGNAPKRLQNQTQIASNTQWVSGDTADTNTTSIAEQLVYQDGPWKAQVNGTGLLNSVLGPEKLQTSVGHFNNYVVSGSMQKGAWGLNLSFGAVAPSLYRNAQFVTTAAPRQGIEADLKTPAGTFDFYANTDDIGAGSGVGYGFHQQILGASWDLPLPKKYLELRLMWLSSHDTGTASTVHTDISGQTSTITDTLAVPGGGDLYGALLQVHLAPKWLWTSEYAWGYNDTTLAGELTHKYGRAARTNVAGTSGSFSMNVSYLDVSQNFASPANPSLSPNSTPDRRGPSGTFVFTTHAGTFSFADTYLQSNFHEINFAEQEMNSAVGSWSKNINKITVLTLAGHETFTATGDVPAAVQVLPTDQKLAFEADQRDLGANLSLTRQVGKTASLTFSGARDWFRNNLVQNANTITSSLTMGANWVARPYFQVNGNVSLNWMAGAGSTVGTTRSFSGFLQPTLTWKRTGLQLQPLISINQTRTWLVGDILTNDLLSQQYGGRLAWTMPRKLKVSTLTVNGNYTEVKNPVANFQQQGKTLYLLWTVSWGYKHPM
jgi:hypothetical protein